MQYIKTNNGISFITDNGKVVLFPYGTFEFWLASKENNFDDFPFIKPFVENGNFFGNFKYDVKSFRISYKGIFLNLSTTNALKELIWKKEYETVEKFEKFIEKLNFNSLLIFNTYFNGDRLKSQSDLSYCVLDMTEDDVAVFFSGKSISSNEGLSLEVMAVADDDGNLVLEEAFPKDYNKSVEFTSVFKYWTKFLLSKKIDEDFDKFFDSLNKTLDTKYNISQFNSEETNNFLLSNVINNTVKTSSNEDDYDEIF